MSFKCTHIYQYISKNQTTRKWLKACVSERQVWSWEEKEKKVHGTMFLALVFLSSLLSTVTVGLQTEKKERDLRVWKEWRNSVLLFTHVRLFHEKWAVNWEWKLQKKNWKISPFYLSFCKLSGTGFWYFPWQYFQVAPTVLALF
jgi:hypothetical protein